MFTAWIHDTRHALRTLSRQPLFTAFAVLGLGFGIGVTLAIHSLFYQAVLRPLPAYAPQQIVNLVASGIKEGPTSTSRAGWRDAIFSYPKFRDLQQVATQSRAFTGIAAHRSFRTNVALGDRTMSGTGMLVSGNYFGTLGLAPAIGRLLQEADDEPAGASLVAVLAYDYWRNTLGGDPRVLDRDLRVNGLSLRIVGVAPQGFAGTTFGITPQVYVPIGLRWQLQPELPDDHADRRSWWVYLFGRLAPGVTAGQARDALNGPYAAMLRDIELPLQQGLDANRRMTFLAGRIALEPGLRGQSDLSHELRTPMLMLLASGGLILLVACLNLANLLVARGIGRNGDLALRASIGASRGRIARQVAAECFVLAAGGLLFAIPVAGLALRGLVSVLPDGAAFVAGLTVAPTTCAFAVLVTMAALLLFAVLPAWHAAALSPALALRGDLAQTTGSRGAMRLRAGLVILQTALSMAALALAGLFAQSLYKLGHEPLGVDAQSIASFTIHPGRSGYTAERAGRLFDQIDRDLAALPGVEATSYSQVQLFSNDIWQTNVLVDGEPPPAQAAPPIFNRVGEEYFRTLGIPLLAGRTFNRGDATGSPPVAIVSRGFARHFGLGANPLGRHFSFEGNGPSGIEIVGVVADSKVSGVRAEEPLQIYLPRRQDPSIAGGTWYVRTGGQPGALLASLQASVAALDPQLPVEDLHTLTDTIARNLAAERFVGALAVAFAAMATALAAMGLFGVVAYVLSRRRRELGVRLALGAAPLQLAGMLLAHIGRLGAIGLALGIVLAVIAGRLAQALLFGVQGSDPLTLVSAAVLLAAGGAAAMAAPALRIRRIDPAKVLREA
jgi:predicted permease